MRLTGTMQPSLTPLSVARQLLHLCRQLMTLTIAGSHVTTLTGRVGAPSTDRTTTSHSGQQGHSPVGGKIMTVFASQVCRVEPAT